NLDRRSAEVVAGLLAGLAAEGLTVIVVTHDQQIAESMGRLLEIDDGLVTERATATIAGASGPSGSGVPPGGAVSPQASTARAAQGPGDGCPPAGADAAGDRTAEVRTAGAVGSSGRGTGGPGGATPRPRWPGSEFRPAGSRRVTLCGKRSSLWRGRRC